jgi:quercetin dioxygenase-like cupin family protein
MGPSLPIRSISLASALALGCVAYLAMVQTRPLPLAVSASGPMEDAMPMSSAAATRPKTTVTPISCERLPHVPGKSITTALVAFPPNAYTPRHRHPGSVTAYVLKGALRSQLLGSPAETYTAGQSWFEPPGAVHLFAENASTTEPAELLAIFIADDDCGPLTIPDPVDR